MTTAYSKYVPKWERPVITALCKALLDRGYLLAIHNGEEYESKRTNKWHSLRPHFGSTGEDSLVVWKVENGEKVRQGYWYLIYNNGSEEEPTVVISDYAWANDETEEIFDTIWNELNQRES